MGPIEYIKPDCMLLTIAPDGEYRSYEIYPDDIFIKPEKYTQMIYLSNQRNIFILWCVQKIRYIKPEKNIIIKPGCVFRRNSSSRRNPEPPFASLPHNRWLFLLLFFSQQVYFFSFLYLTTGGFFFFSLSYNRFFFLFSSFLFTTGGFFFFSSSSLLYLTTGVFFFSSFLFTRDLLSLFLLLFFSHQLVQLPQIF